MVFTVRITKDQVSIVSLISSCTQRPRLKPDRHSSCAFASAAKYVVKVTDLASVAKALVVVMAVRARRVLGFADSVRVVGVSLLTHQRLTALDVALTFLRLLNAFDTLARLENIDRS